MSDPDRRGQIAAGAYALAVLLVGFVLSAALVGLWVGLAWRFVWITAP